MRNLRLIDFTFQSKDHFVPFSKYNASPSTRNNFLFFQIAFGAKFDDFVFSLVRQFAILEILSIAYLDWHSMARISFEVKLMKTSLARFYFEILTLKQHFCLQLSNFNLQSLKVFIPLCLLQSGL